MTLRTVFLLVALLAFALLCAVARDRTRPALAERRFAALYRQDDRVVGVLAMNRPRLVATYRPLIERSASWDEALSVT